MSTLTLFLLLSMSTPAKSQNWCCCQVGCIQDIFFIGCDAYCAGLGGGINHGADFGYPDPTCGGLLCPPAVPIELSYFEGSVTGDRVKLKWKTDLWFTAQVHTTICLVQPLKSQVQFSAFPLASAKER